ncbi:hypothetical protein ACWV26_11470 [Rummeliibacillus sp. JY-2-4R]
MKSKIGLFSSILFIVGLASYIIALFGKDSYLLVGVIATAIGFLLALFAEKGVYKRIGLIGNGVIVFIGVIFPFIVTTFFWNEP